jgi:uncharacterized membrane protein YqhA
MAVVPGPDHHQPAILRVLGRSRYLIVIAVICILAAAAALLAFGARQTVHLLYGLGLDPHDPEATKTLILGAIELTDLLLLATALYVIAIGLFELFIDNRLVLPSWLEIHDLNDLKEKLIGVLIVVMAVLFLGQVVTWDGKRDLLRYGAATALVIAALTWFVSQKPKE